jgi:CheY-specific phosphatase CheX
MRDLPHADAIGACVELTMFHISRVAGRPNKLGAVSAETVQLEPGRERYSQRIVGDGDFTIAVDLPRELVADIAKGMLGFEVEPGTESEVDAVCEVINLIGGNACTRIEQLGYILRPEPPISWRGGGKDPLVGLSVRATVASAENAFDIWVLSRLNGAA